MVEWRKSRGVRGGQRDAPAVGGQDNTTASHMWVIEGVGVQAAGDAHSGIVIGELDVSDNVARNGSFPQIHPLGSLHTEH